MDLEDIQSTLEKAATMAYLHEEDAMEHELRQAAKSLADESGKWWTQADNLAIALNAIRIMATPPLGGRALENIRETAEAELAKWKEENK